MFNLHKLPLNQPLFNTCDFYENVPGCSDKSVNMVWDDQLHTVKLVCNEHLEKLLNSFNKSVCCPNCQCHIGIN